MVQDPMPASSIEDTAANSEEADSLHKRAQHRLYKDTNRPHRPMKAGNE